MKRVNAAGPALLAELSPPLRRVSARELQAHLSDWLVLDARPEGSFAAAHIPGSICIALAPNLPTWAGWVLPYDKPIVIVAADAKDANEVITHLLRVGFDQIEGVLEGGINEWAGAGFDVGTLPTMSVQSLADELRKPPAQRPLVFDVRTDGEWAGGHIEGATHIQLGALPNELAKVPKDHPVAVTCGSGYRSTIAGSILQRNGYRNIINIVGGMGAWKAAKLPVVK